MMIEGLSEKISEFNDGCIYGKIDKARPALEWILEHGGVEAVREVLSYDKYYRFYTACHRGHTDIVKLNLKWAKECGGDEMVKDMLSVKGVHGKYTGFTNACYNGHPDIVKLNLDAAASLKDIGGELAGDMIRDSNFYGYHISSNTGDVSSKLLQVSHKNTPQELREIFCNSIKSPDDSGENKKFGYRIPDKNKLGKDGEVYEYAAYRLVVHKLTELQNAFKGVDFDIRRIIANSKASVTYNNETGEFRGDVNWRVLLEQVNNISDKMIGKSHEVQKAFNYIAHYIVAEEYKGDNRLAELERLKGEDLAKITDPVKDKITKYFLENKNLSQIVKMYEQWRRHRISMVKTTGETLRDFAEEGSWYHTLPKKEIEVTEKGLEGYSIYNITHSYELDAEGKALKHCASADGVTECKKGYQVYSIRFKGNPKSTMGFEVSEGNLVFNQNRGYGDFVADENEKSVQKWFLEEIEKGNIKLDLSRIGEIPMEKTKSDFENNIGIALKDLTSERVQANLDLITNLAKKYEQWSNNGSGRDIYMLGAENRNTSIEELIARTEDKKLAARTSRIDHTSRRSVAVESQLG